MPLFVLDKELTFPPVHLAEPDGLLAMGGDLSSERLLLAYRSGIFPWYEGDTILWWCPHPRFVLYPEELKISKSIKPLLNRNEFEFTTNKAFAQVIHHCKKTKRPGQDGTWITDEVEKAYCKLHELGYAHSAEVWKEGKLIGGLYGIKLGKVFFGESMFSTMSNASRFAFIKYVLQLKSEGIELIDCQVYTEYLESLGARMISGAEFDTLLKKLIP
ncbi:MAG: leucyl/phenylalanyl-tRNA--protein transferase [Chitinophagaceae bacterium]|nr:leucyl/phenylalanyl-tRNA--protein transferase [Chitinophagaceae bacterium]MBK8301627.1 leucyl/phenylalanyl-tRNA--protein transferase [Chitinophagaceae bacterium]MBK9938909.1 leucyl/phenylalanyl-tRNA--protein transferase [Chitinophagaceae bacterium]